MKRLADIGLLAFFLLSLVAYAFGLFVHPDDLIATHIYRLYVGPIIPAFCLQLFLCRRVPCWGAMLLSIASGGLALISAFWFVFADGWDKLGWALLMVIFGTATIGCIIAWTVYGLYQLYKCGDIH